MRTIIFVVVCLFSALAITSFAWAEGEGRYELFQGEYSRYDGAEGIYVKTQDVFMIDTVTGDVTIFMSSSDDKGRRVRYWEPAVIDETKGSFGT